MTGAQEEVPFIAGFERQPEASKEDDTKRLFREDSATQRLILTAQEVTAAAQRAVEKVMGMISGRGHDPDAAYEQEENAYERGVRAGSRIGNRNVGGVNGNSWSTWILGIVGALIAAGILGLTTVVFSMNDRLARVETKVDILLPKDHR